MLVSTRIEAVTVRGGRRIENRTKDHGPVRLLLPCALRLRAGLPRERCRMAGLARRHGLQPGGPRPGCHRRRCRRRGRQWNHSARRLLRGRRRRHGRRAGDRQGLSGAAGRWRRRGRHRHGSRRVVNNAMSTSLAPPPSFLATRRGKVTLALLCAVTFLDVVDGSIVNVALPTIRAHLGFSVQNLQWVVSGYLITYGGFLLVGRRARDPLGPRRLLGCRTPAFAPSSVGRGAVHS